MNKNLLTFLWLLLFAINSHAQTCNLNVTIQKTQIACYGTCTGTANALVTGAVGNVSYLWSTGQTTQAISQLCVGPVTVTVTDVGCANCSQTVSANITSRGKIGHTDYQINTSCFGVCDGQDSLKVTGGTPPYSYLWNTGATTAVITGLCAGTYSVTTTDANGCQNFCRHHVVSDPPLLVAVSESTPTCAGSCNGTVTVHASGGTKPYTFTWATGVGDSTASGLCAALYHIVITDAHGCTTYVDQNVADINPDDNNGCTVDACDPLTFAITHTPVIIDDNNACTIDCCNPANGNITHNPVNTDDNNVCTTDCCNPATGAITHNPININDNNPCTIDACNPVTGITHTLNIPSCTISINNLCYGGGTTQLCAPAGQGTYLWNNGATTQCINVTSGTYTVTVTSSGNCSSTCSYTIQPPPTYWGCTLGFWKNHTSIWNNSNESIPQCLAGSIAAKGAGYSGNGTSSSYFRTTFGLTSAQMNAAGYSANMTLLDALNQGGGGFQKLARQGTAALLNTCGLSGHYTYNASQVITNIHNAVVAHIAEPLATQLADANEAQPDNCPSTSGGCGNHRLVQLGVITDDNITATAYPNPFSSQATIQFIFTQNTPNVSVEVFDASGRKVATLFNDNAVSDNLYKLSLNGENLPQGIYTYRINTDDVTYYNKLVLMK